MQFDEEATADVLARLRRIQGQVGGIIRMVEAGRPYREIVQQISAAGRALDQTGFKMVAWGLRHCLQDEAAGGAGDSQDELEKLFLQLRQERARWRLGWTAPAVLALGPPAGRRQTKED